MKIIICAAFKKEIIYFLRYYKPHLVSVLRNKYPLYSWQNKQDTIYFYVVGMGSKNVRNNIEELIQCIHPDQQWVWILTGYAGAIKKTLKPGDLMIPSMVKDHEKEYHINLDNFLFVSRGEQLFSVPHIYNKNEKYNLSQTDPSLDAVDMESAAFCRVLQEKGMNKFFIIKSITDAYNFIFPDYSLIRESLFRIKLRNVFLHFKDMKNCVLLYHYMHKASKNLFKFFKKWYENHSTSNT